MNQRLPITLIILGIAAFACATTAPLVASAVPPGSDTPILPSEFVPTVVTSTPTFEGCAYMWASQELPELSRRLNKSLQALSPDITALAYAYGENCVYGDGHLTFSAMETDFRIGVTLKNIEDEAALGDWIARIMAVVQALPPDQLSGPQPGRVDFDFKQRDAGEVFITVPLDKYTREAKGLKGAELLHLFYTKP